MLRRAVPAFTLAAVGFLMMIPVAPAQAGAQVVRARADAARFGSFAPRNGPMGTEVTIIGSGFKGANRVAFHGVAATFTVVSNTRVTAIVPCGTTSGRISVRTPRGMARSTGSFTIP